MQTNQTGSRTASPILDLIGAAAPRGRHSEADLPFESLLEPLPPLVALPPPAAQPPQSAIADGPPRVPDNGSSRRSNVAEDEHADEADTQSQPAIEEGPPVGAAEAKADSAVIADETASEAGGGDDDSDAAPVDAAGAEEVLAATLAAIGAASQPVLTEQAPQFADEEIPISGAEELAPGPAATPAAAVQLASLGGPLGAEVAVTAIQSEEPALAIAAMPEVENATQVERAAVPTELGTIENAAGRLLNQAVEAETAEPIQAVEPVATAEDDSPSNGDSEANSDSGRTQELPAAQLLTEGLLETLPAEQQVEMPQPPVAASGEAAPRDSATSAIATPSADTALGRTRLPTSILGAAGPQGGRHSAEMAVDSVRLLQRVARAFAAAHERGGEIRLRLSPPELGALRLEVQMQDGAMVARVEAETSVARTAIIENLSALRERLAEQGVRIERFDVDLMNRQGGGTPDRQANSDRDPADQPRPVLAATAKREAAMVPASSSVAAIGQGRLNVII